MATIDVRFAKQVFAAVREGKAQQEATAIDRLCRAIDTACRLHILKPLAKAEEELAIFRGQFEEYMELCWTDHPVLRGGQYILQGNQLRWGGTISSFASRWERFVVESIGRLFMPGREQDFARTCQVVSSHRAAQHILMNLIFELQLLCATERTKAGPFQLVYSTNDIFVKMHQTWNGANYQVGNYALEQAGTAAMVAEVNALFGKIGLPADMLTPGPNGGTVILSI